MVLTTLFRMERLHLEIRYMTQLDDSLAISKVYEVNMITNGENIIEKVIAIMGKRGHLVVHAGS